MSCRSADRLPFIDPNAKERLHYWVFGGPWSYENEPQGDPAGEDAEYMNEVTAKR